MESEPWKIVSHLFPDLVFLVEGKKLYYHQAVIAQHSQLVRSLLIKTSCCKCQGADCSRNAGNVFISLDGVKIETVQYVMDMIYAGSGNIAGDTDDYKHVLEMLQINTIVVDALNSFEGFVLEEILSEVGGDMNLEMIQDVLQDPTGSTTNVIEVEKSKSIDQELKETNKALKKLEKEKKKLAAEEKKKKEMENKRDLRRRNRKSTYSEAVDNKDERKSEKGDDVESIGLSESQSQVQTDTIVIHNKSKDESSKSQPISTSSKDDDDCEIILDSEEEGKSNVSSVEINKTQDAERYICPFKDCRSESKNAQSIKVHLALVHYKKSIQSEFPNWKKQKCDECEKSFGQMTAYYLHMANHKKYQYMDLPAQAMVHKEDKKSSIQNKTKNQSNDNKSNPLVKPSSHLSISKPMASSVSSLSASSTASVKTSGAIIKPSIHARSSSYTSQTQASSNVLKTTPGQPSPGAGFTRSKSFVQAKSQPQSTSSSIKPIITRTPTGSKTGLATSSFGRPAPPGPPGPGSSSASLSRSNSFSKTSSPLANTSNKISSTPPITPSQRRLSAPYSVVTKRTGSLERTGASNDPKKPRGSK